MLPLLTGERLVHGWTPWWAGPSCLTPPVSSQEESLQVEIVLLVTEIVLLITQSPMGLVQSGDHAVTPQQLSSVCAGVAQFHLLFSFIARQFWILIYCVSSPGRDVSC